MVSQHILIAQIIQSKQIVIYLVLPALALQERFPDWKKTNERPQKNLAAFQNHGQSRSAMVEIALQSFSK